MDLQLHYNKIRNEESRMTDEFPVIVSHETADGGKEGILAEVTRRIAARFITLGLARLASGDEAKFFRDAKREASDIAVRALQEATFSATALSLKTIEKLQAELRSKE